MDRVDVDFKRLRTPLVPEDQLIPQQLLALSTIDRAVLDSGLKKGGRVAVIIGLGTDMELYRHRARVTMRERFGKSVSSESQSNTMNYVNRVGTSTSYVSYIGNLLLPLPKAAIRSTVVWTLPVTCYSGVTLMLLSSVVLTCVVQQNLCLSKQDVPKCLPTKNPPSPLINPTMVFL